MGRKRRTKLEIASRRVVREARPQSAQVNALNGLSHASWQTETGLSAEISAALRLQKPADFLTLPRGGFGITAGRDCAIYCWCHYRFVAPAKDLELKTFPNGKLTDFSVQCPNCRRMLFCEGYLKTAGRDEQ